MLRRTATSGSEQIRRTERPACTFVSGPTTTARDRTKRDPLLAIANAGMREDGDAVESRR